MSMNMSMNMDMTIREFSLFYGIINFDFLSDTLINIISILCFLILFLNRKIIMLTIKSIINRYILSPVSDRLILKPEPFDQKKYDKWIQNPYVVHEKIHTKDGEILDAMFYNANNVPTYDDEVIYMYSHGNSGWSSLVLESTTCVHLAKTGSVFVYDYRGYGKSTGKPSSLGCLKDSVEAYKFLVYVKNVDPKRIILFGHSLGACVTSYLMNHLIQKNDNNLVSSSLPKTKFNSKVMIIQNAFENIQRVCNDVVPFFGKFVVSDMTTDLYIRNIDNMSNDIDICIVHSKDDELIHSNHSMDLAKRIMNNRLKLILLEGTHDNPVHDTVFDQYLQAVSKSD